MIVLVGFMGAGKTTVGHILAERLGTAFVDSDVYLERQLGRTIADVFAVDGEQHFRELEHRAINELVRGPDAVLALGGGALGDPRTRAILRNTTVVYLRVGYDEALSRVRQDRFRPMLQRADLDQVYAGRLAAYAEVAAVQVDTNGRRPDAIVLDVLRELTRLPSTPAGTSNILVTPVGGTYYVHVGRGLLDLAGDLLPDAADIEQAVIVESDRDTGTADRVAASLTARGISVTRVPIPDTEAAKTFATAQHVAGHLADVALHTNDLVVAVGGEPVMRPRRIRRRHVQPGNAARAGAHDARRPGRFRHRRQERGQHAAGAQPRGRDPPTHGRHRRRHNRVRERGATASAPACPRSPSTR